MATPNGEYRSARKMPNRSAVIVSQYIDEPDLPKRSGARAGGPNTGDRGFEKFSCIKLQPLVVQSDKVSSVAKTSPMQKQKRPVRYTHRSHPKKVLTKSASRQTVRMW
jgi:hypothetical protein